MVLNELSSVMFLDEKPPVGSNGFAEFSRIFKHTHGLEVNQLPDKKQGSAVVPEGLYLPLAPSPRLDLLDPQVLYRPGEKQ